MVLYFMNNTGATVAKLTGEKSEKAFRFSKKLFRDFLVALLELKNSSFL